MPDSTTTMTAMSTPPLAGLRVLDMSMLTPGPFATQILADLGATVLKVERPPIGDLERLAMPAYFRAYNRGKYSIALDLKQAADRSEFDRLVRDADVFFEGFRPGAAERLGAGFERLKTLKTDLVYVSLSGFGPGGPRIEEKAHDPEFQALAGSLHYNRGTDGKPVYNTAGPTFDYAAAMYAVVAVLASLPARARTGAVRIEVPCFAAGFAWMFPRLVDALESGREIATQDIIMAGSDGKYLTVAATEDSAWPPLCKAIGRPDLLARPELATFDGRLRHAGELNAILRAAIATEPRDAWAARLAAAGVSSAPILDPHEVVDDPQVRHMDLIRHAPALHARTPIYGLPTLMHVNAPDLDQHGAPIRAGGWAALSPAQAAEVVK
ncbi:MAG: CaiB/BaiF CoA transferase family protein [Gammaproteobacteria bacterium]